MAQNAERITQDIERRIAERRILVRRTQFSGLGTPKAERRVAERRIFERRIADLRPLNAEPVPRNAEHVKLYAVHNTQSAHKNSQHATHNVQRRAPSFLAGGIVAVIVVLAGVGGYMAKTFLSDDSPHKKSSPIMVTLMKPPPPPQIKEKPPEPEQLKQPPKEEIFTPTPEDSNPGLDKDNTPAGDSLGVDAEGTAGGDAFGLVGKKGGRSLLAGEGGSGGMGRLSLLIKFAGYAHTVEAEIRKKVMKRLDQDGGIPKGKLQAGVRVRLDGSGAVVDYKIIGSSGNRKMDEAVKQALSDTKLSEPPPDGMPRTMIIKISSQG